MSELRTYDVIMTPSSDGSWVLKSEVDREISAKDAEIRRLHRCIIRMTKQWLSAIEDMYSRLDDVHGLDDDDVDDWEKVSELCDKLDKVLEKWK